MPSSFSPSLLTNTSKLRLICLPYAGGSSAVYHRWRPIAPSEIDLVPLCLPGREARISEPFATDLRQLAGQFAADMQPVLDRPYALMGHSLGAWLAFELALELRRRADPPPLAHVVAACPPPHQPLRDPTLHQLPDDKLVAEVSRRFDGIPPAVRNNPELLQLLLPVLRADMQMGETYRYADDPPLDAEMLALGGTEDPAVSPAQLSEWGRHTTKQCTMRFFPGGHFFLFRDENEPGAGRTATQSRRTPSAPLQTMFNWLRRMINSQQFH